VVDKAEMSSADVWDSAQGGSTRIQDARVPFCDVGGLVRPTNCEREWPDSISVFQTLPKTLDPPRSPSLPIRNLETAELWGRYSLLQTLMQTAGQETFSFRYR